MNSKTNNNYNNNMEPGLNLLDSAEANKSFDGSINNKDEKFEVLQNINTLSNIIKGSSRIEQVYLVADRIVKQMKTLYPVSYCNSCSLTCCNNDLYLELSYLEWRVIQNYLDEKMDNKLKEKIKNNLAKVPATCFQENEFARQKHYLYINILCPFLVDNQCSIAPYRPLACRTYGFFHNQKGNIELKIKRETNSSPTEVIVCCDLEKNRWKNYLKRHHEAEVYLAPRIIINKINNHLNYKKPKKLLIMWLKDYFEQKEK